MSNKRKKSYINVTDSNGKKTKEYFDKDSLMKELGEIVTSIFKGIFK